MTARAGVAPEALLHAVAGEERAPAGGSVAAIVVALAAALAAKAARLSGDAWADAGGAVAQAEALRSRATVLAEADARAYEEAIEALRMPGPELGAALARAAEIPLEIAEAAADVAMLATFVAEHGVADLRGDAAAAAALAYGAARSAAYLVAINLGATSGDPRVVVARSLAEAAGRAAEAALATES